MALAVLFFVLLGLKPESSRAASRPNIVVIQTDDQPVGQFDGFWRDQLDRERRIMPNTIRLLRNRGVEFKSYMTPFPLCAPSRASLLSGNYAHNHGVVRIGGPRGGWEAYRNNEINNENLPVWLQRAGYRTMHFGKFINKYGGPDSPVETTVPPGWDRWVSDATDNSTREFYGYSQNIDGRAAGPFGWPFYDLQTGKDPVGCPWLGPATCNYHTDSMSLQAAAAIEQSGRRPFFIQVDYHTPHGDTRPPIGPEPAVRHYDTALRTPVPRSPGFDEANVSDKPSFLRDVPRLSSREITDIKNENQKSVEALRSVDDGIKWIHDALRKTGKLKNTYVIFTSDNGFFLGQHRISRGKILPYQPAVRVPMVVRGPGIKRRSVSREPVANQDVAPTVLKLAGAQAGRRMDGRSLTRFWEDPKRRTRRPILLSSYTAATTLIPGDYPDEPVTVTGSSRDARVAARIGAQNYIGVRLGPYKYVEYESGDRELYYLKRDPDELWNRIDDPRFKRVVRYLDDELERLRGCRAAACRAKADPWPSPRPVQSRGRAR